MSIFIITVNSNPIRLDIRTNPSKQGPALGEAECAAVSLAAAAQMGRMWVRTVTLSLYMLTVQRSRSTSGADLEKHTSRDLDGRGNGT